MEVAQVDPLIARILMDSTNLNAYIQSNYKTDKAMLKAMRRLHNRIKFLDRAYSQSIEEWTYSLPLKK